MNAPPGFGFAELLTTAEMAGADQRAVALGVPFLALMENAGRAVADEAGKMVAPGARIAVLCGPGNNGGDGFVAARLLAGRGFDVRVGLLGDRSALKGDAAVMAAQWSGTAAALTPSVLDGAALVIDAIFGAGLNRPVPPDVEKLIAAIRKASMPVLSVDVPSGLDGNSGSVLGYVIRATKTVTFFRKKPGHLLLPGRTLCGEVVVADIGMPPAVLSSPFSPSGSWPERGEGWDEGRVLGDIQAAAPHAHLAPHPSPLPIRVIARDGERGLDRANAVGAVTTFENTLPLWLDSFPWPQTDRHKYSRGHAVVISGPAHQTGAARLGARGALRVGAGLVTVASPPQSLAVNAAHLTAIMVTPFAGARDLAELLHDSRKNAVLIGPGLSVGEETRDLVATVLASSAAVVLDADALTSFAETTVPGAQPTPFGFTAKAREPDASPAHLLALIKAHAAPVIITPHEGEFSRLFPAIEGSKLERARAAAKVSGAIVVLKGADTVIADPDGRAAINANAPPWLATAGSGDVLAGFITGLLAQGMPAFAAACAAVWLHGECANAFGAGLIAEDLSEVLPKVLAGIRRPE